MVQAEDISGEEVPSGQISSFAQVTEQPNMHLNTQSVINHHHFGSSHQFASPPYEPPCGNTHSARIEVDSLRAFHSPGASSLVHPSSANQVPRGSTPGPCLAEDGFDPNPFTIELSRLQKLHNLITKRHQEKVSFLNSSSTSVFLSYFKMHVHIECTLLRCY